MSLSEQADLIIQLILLYCYNFVFTFSINNDLDMSCSLLFFFKDSGVW